MQLSPVVHRAPVQGVPFSAVEAEHAPLLPHVSQAGHDEVPQQKPSTQDVPLWQVTEPPHAWPSGALAWQTPVDVSQ
jgi:hypothetical protein